MRQAVLDLGEADPRHGALRFRDFSAVDPVHLLLDVDRDPAGAPAEDAG